MLPRIHGPQGPRTHPGHRPPRSLGSLVIGLSASLAPGSLGPRILDPRALGYSPLSPWAPESRAYGPENSGPLASWPVGSSDVGSPRRVDSGPGASAPSPRGFSGPRPLNPITRGRGSAGLWALLPPGSSDPFGISASGPVGLWVPASRRLFVALILALGALDPKPLGT